jgi:hypothetical protein
MQLIAINNDRFDSRLATLNLEMPAGRSIVQVVKVGKTMKRDAGDLRYYLYIFRVHSLAYASMETLKPHVRVTG